MICRRRRQPTARPSRAELARAATPAVRTRGRVRRQSCFYARRPPVGGWVVLAGALPIVRSAAEAVRTTDDGVRGAGRAGGHPGRAGALPPSSCAGAGRGSVGAPLLLTLGHEPRGRTTARDRRTLPGHERSPRAERGRRVRRRAAPTRTHNPRRAPAPGRGVGATGGVARGSTGGVREGSALALAGGVGGCRGRQLARRLAVAGRRWL